MPELVWFRDDWNHGLEGGVKGAEWMSSPPYLGKKMNPSLYLMIVTAKVYTASSGIVNMYEYYGHQSINVVEANEVNVPS